MTSESHQFLSQKNLLTFGQGQIKDSLNLENMETSDQFYPDPLKAKRDYQSLGSILKSHNQLSANSPRRLKVTYTNSNTNTFDSQAKENFVPQRGPI